MKLLVEQCPDDYEVITEAKEGGGKTFKIRGIFMQAEAKNRNGRIYRKNTLLREANRFIENYVNRQCAYGELDHPPTPQVNLKNVSHLITSLKVEGNDFIGEATLLDTIQGQQAQALLKAGCRLGVSSRGVGQLDKTANGNFVREDYHLVTPADIVADPSAPKAFVEGIMEGAEWVYVDGVGWSERFLDESKTRIRKVSRKDIVNEEIRIFSEFMKRLRTETF